MRVLQGLGHSGPFPCISSRTVPCVSQQCGLPHNRFIRLPDALAPASRLITPLGVQLGVLPAIPAKAVARFPRET
ncbi:MAG: hypothetical protein RBR73_07850, partial [Halothiobacillaceae bacterium]|nr:hypothetical protein [Halothiobacillaceae bacterium]